MHRGRLLTLLLVNSSPIEKHWKLHFTRPYEKGWEASAVLSTANSLTLVCRKFHICHELATLKSVVNRRFWEITTSGLFGLWKREYPCQNLWTEASVSDTPLAMTGPSNVCQQVLARVFARPPPIQPWQRYFSEFVDCVQDEKPDEQMIKQWNFEMSSWFT